MKTYYEQLREIISQVLEIKKDLEELRFGTEVEYIIFDGSTDIAKYCFQLGLKVFLTDSGLEIENSDILKIIGNPIEERHIRIYCENKKLSFAFTDKQLLIYNVSILNGGITLQLDNSKPFHLQDEQVYKQLVDYFLNNNLIGNK